MKQFPTIGRRSRESLNQETLLREFLVSNSWQAIRPNLIPKDLDRNFFEQNVHFVRSLILLRIPNQIQPGTICKSAGSGFRHFKKGENADLQIGDNPPPTKEGEERAGLRI